MTKPGQFARGNKDMLAAISRSAVNDDTVVGCVIAPVPLFGIHTNGISNAPFEKGFERLGGDPRQHQTKHVHRRIPVGVLRTGRAEQSLRVWCEWRVAGAMLV